MFFLLLLLFLFFFHKWRSLNFAPKCVSAMTSSQLKFAEKHSIYHALSDARKGQECPSTAKVLTQCLWLNLNPSNLVRWIDSWPFDKLEPQVESIQREWIDSTWVNRFNGRAINLEWIFIMTPSHAWKSFVKASPYFFYNIFTDQVRLRRGQIQCCWMWLVRITSWYPNFNGSHFGLPPSEIHRMTGLPPKIMWTMTYSHRPIISHDFRRFSRTRFTRWIFLHFLIEGAHYPFAFQESW